MEFLLSITTSIKKPGSRIWYDDQRMGREEVFDPNGLISYDYMRGGIKKAQNQHLHNAHKHNIFVVYFRGIAPQLYMPLLARIAHCDDMAQKARVNCQGLLCDSITNPIEIGPGSELSPKQHREYVLRPVEQRLHQAKFRAVVVSAYSGRCAISGLPMPNLLDAAHIIPDRDPDFGQPVVQNGLALSKLHHAAFDQNFLGITPDYELKVSEKLLEIKDGPVMETLKELSGLRLHLPKRKKDYPDQDRLEMRYEEFQKAT